MKKNIITKIAALALVGIMAFGFSGCDSTNTSEDSANDNSVVDNDNANPDPNNDADAPPAPANNNKETFKDYSNKSADNGKSAKWLWMDDCMEDILGDGTLFEITFRIKQDAADGNYSVVINDFAMCNVPLEVVNAKIIDGVVTVGSAEAPAQDTADETSITLVNTKGNAGDTIKMSVTMSKNPGFCTAQMGISYDSSALEIVDVTGSGLLGEIGSVQKNINAE